MATMFPLTEGQYQILLGTTFLPKPFRYKYITIYIVYYIFSCFGNKDLKTSFVELILP